jgi:hypothetical protein
MENLHNSNLELQPDKNSCLVLVDYQSSMFRSATSGDKTINRNVAYCAAKGARILNAPLFCHQ